MRDSHSLFEGNKYSFFSVSAVQEVMGVAVSKLLKFLPYNRGNVVLLTCPVQRESSKRQLFESHINFFPAIHSKNKPL